MTDNPWLIMAINMTIVFAVLILLGVLMHIIYLVDPTKKKSTKAEVAEVSSAAAPSVASTTTNHDEVVAAIVAAVCAMIFQITNCFRKTDCEHRLEIGR